MRSVKSSIEVPARGLGLDAGGTQTRWAVADATGQVWAEGSAAAMSGLQLGSADGDAALAQQLHDIAHALPGPVAGVAAGITGLDAAQWPALCARMADAFAVPLPRVRAMSDIELACRAAYPQAAQGGGIVVYAGTGSIAALIDEHGQLQRAGGRGALIDDAGGGHWIAREALRIVWRAEDEAPGAWRQSLLAQRVFQRIGGSDWSHTRAWAYGASRGEIGVLALAVAEAAQAGDPQALDLLQRAGRELARLANAMTRRYGPQPLTLAGRAFELHAAVENALRAELPPGTAVHHLARPAHHAAAMLAAQT